MKTADFIKGIALAFVATYLFVVLLSVFNSQIWNGSYSGSYRDLFIDTPVFFLALASWFVLPVGGIMGIVIPYPARQHSPQVAICFGLAMGILVGVSGGIFASYQTATIETFSSSSDTQIDHAAWWASFWRNMIRQGSIMSLYSMAWTGGYAYFKTKRFRQQQVIQEAS